MNKTELQIISRLNQNARRSYREIARETGLSVTAVIQTIKRLEKNGAIKGYAPVLNPEYFGFSLMAVINLRISQGQLLATQKNCPGPAGDGGV